MNRLVHWFLNLIIMTSIVALCASALICAHCGALQLLSGGGALGGRLLGIAGGLALASMFMIRNRNDLAER